MLLKHLINGKKKIIKEEGWAQNSQITGVFAHTILRIMYINTPIMI